MSPGKKLRPDSTVAWCGREVGQHGASEQGLDGVVAQEGAEQGGNRRQVRRPCRRRRRYPVGYQTVIQRGGQRSGETDDHQGEEDPDREDLGGVLEGRVHSRAHTAVLGRQAVHHPGTVGRGEGAHGQTVEEQYRGEYVVGEVDGQSL